MNKLNVWDSSFLAENYNVASQAVTRLIAVAESLEESVELSALPPSMFPTETLYNICVGYMAMHDALSEHKLLSSGNGKKPSSKIH